MNPMHASQLVLGTAQLGMPYGIANRTGQPNQEVATEIIREAWESGIREYDTAQAYGTSEIVLGTAFAENGITSEVKVITKFDPRLDHLNASILSEAMDQSLKRMNLQHLYGIMLHREEMLSLWKQGVSKIFSGLVKSGRVSNIGVAVYSPDKAIEAINMDDIDMIQIPNNILDRRFENAGVYELAERANKKIYIRSIFLQGLLLMRPDEVPDELGFARFVVESLDTLSRDCNLSRQEMAMGYLKKRMPNAHLVFGAETPMQVEENVKASQKTIPESLCQRILATFTGVPENLLNPVLWTR